MSPTDGARALFRVAGAGLLGAMAGIHFDLWNEGYRTIPTIGPLFLVNGIVGSVLCLAVLAAPSRLLRFAAAAGAGLLGGTLLALVVTVRRGLFGFIESTQATLFWQSVVVEVAGTAVLLALVVLSWPRGQERVGPAPVRAAARS